MSLCLAWWVVSSGAFGCGAISERLRGYLLKSLCKVHTFDRLKVCECSFCAQKHRYVCLNVPRLYLYSKRRLKCRPEFIVSHLQVHIGFFQTFLDNIKGYCDLGKSRYMDPLCLGEFVCLFRRTR